MRDLGDALKRRCLHLHIGLPGREARSADRRDAACPTSPRTCAGSWSASCSELRTLDLKKLPSVSETIDWARVLVLLHAPELDHDVVRDTLNVLLKFEATSRRRCRRSPTFIAKVVAAERLRVTPG